jgi:hypothetical protein
VRKIGLFLVSASMVLLAACGGGGSSTPTSSITAVSVSCSPSTVTSGGTSQCSATVSGTGSFSTAVNWSASAGTITSAGVFTAPTVTTSTVVTITATSTQDSSKSGTASVTVNPSTSTSNVQPIVVDQGPEGVSGSVNIPYTTVTVCVPGTNTCQSIDHVLVDTGSYGLRLISSVLTISLPQELDSSGNPLAECLAFLDGYVWGPVQTATVSLAGESAASIPVQVMIPTTSSPPVPASCSNQNPPGGNGNEGVSVSAFGANGVIGVGLFAQDCGLGCTPGYQLQPVYYDCPSSGCTETSVTLAQQVPNPVSLFATDNNGVLVSLPSVPDGGSPTVTGSLIFGIGTQTNNQLGSATIYAVPDSGTTAGDFTTTYNGSSLTQSFIDSGSNGFFFNDSGIATCSGGNSSWYCPSTSPDNLSAQNQGDNMSSGVTVNFSLENANNLFNTNNYAFSTLGGPGQSGSFDWGLPFFYGRPIFTAIDGTNTPGGTGPYFAY